MPLEVVTTINTLDPASPAHDESLGDADGHIRNIKASLLTTFANVKGPVTLSDSDLNAIPQAILAAAAQAQGAAVAQALATASQYTDAAFKREGDARSLEDYWIRRDVANDYAAAIATRSAQLQSNINGVAGSVVSEGNTRQVQVNAVDGRVTALAADFKVIGLDANYFRAELYGGLKVAMGYGLGVSNGGVVAYNFHFQNVFTILVSDQSSVGNRVGAWKRDAETFLVWARDANNNPTSTSINFIAVGI